MVNGLAPMTVIWPGVARQKLSSFKDAEKTETSTLMR
jgi:hypothetical protein